MSAADADSDAEEWINALSDGQVCPGDAAAEFTATDAPDGPAPPVLAPLLATDQAVVPTLLAGPRVAAASANGASQAEPVVTSPVVIGLGSTAPPPRRTTEAVHRFLLDRAFTPPRAENPDSQETREAAETAWRLLRCRSVRNEDGSVEAPNDRSTGPDNDDPSGPDPFPFVAFLMDAIFSGNR
jgi:hypothetical protein